MLIATANTHNTKRATTAKNIHAYRNSQHSQHGTIMQGGKPRSPAIISFKYLMHVVATGL